MRMFLRRYEKTAAIVFGLIVAVTPLAQVSAAETIWNKQLTGWVVSCVPADASAQKKEFCDGPTTIGFANPNVTVHYRAYIYNADTGDVIPPDGTVVAGTKLKLVFSPHVSNDIYWFSTGSLFDSPYGDWIPGAWNLGSASCAFKDYTGTDVGGVGVGDVFSDLSVAPPERSLAGTDSMSCGAFNPAGTDCTATTLGRQPISFAFGATAARFFGSLGKGRRAGAISSAAYDQCLTSGFPMRLTGRLTFGGNTAAANAAKPTSFPVDAKTIPYPITVVNAVGQPPTAPSVSATTTCAIGSPFSFDITATDPDGDQIRYGVDWDGDGTLDQLFPSSGYVHSGTTLTATRTYAVPGSKHVKVFAQDVNGRTSPWSDFSVPCGRGLSGSVGFHLNVSQGVQLASLELRAVPSLVKSGETTTLAWYGVGVLSCAVVGSNGDGGAADPNRALWQKKTSPAVGVESSPITQQTTYTLTCTRSAGGPITKSIVVNIIPGFQER